MGHCGGGVGPNRFGNSSAAGDADHNVFAALEQWVEKGVAHEKIIGAGNVVGDRSKTFTHPLPISQNRAL
jgi:hypothetical protein